MDLKGRVYIDFAKKLIRIQRMKDGKQKAKSLIILHDLKELLFK